MAVLMAERPDHLPPLADNKPELGRLRGAVVPARRPLRSAVLLELAVGDLLDFRPHLIAALGERLVPLLVARGVLRGLLIAEVRSDGRGDQQGKEKDEALHR